MGQQGSLGPKKWVNWGQRGLKLLVGVSGTRKWVSGGQQGQKMGQQVSAGPISESAVPENGSSGVNGAKKLGQQGRWG